MCAWSSTFTSWLILGFFNSLALIDGGLELDGEVDWDTAHLVNPSLELDLGNPDNVISWDVLRRLIGGPNFGPSYYDRGQFFLTMNFALECPATSTVFLNHSSCPLRLCNTLHGYPCGVMY